MGGYLKAKYFSSSLVEVLKPKQIHKSKKRSKNSAFIIFLYCIESWNKSNSSLKRNNSPSISGRGSAKKKTKFKAKQKNMIAYDNNMRKRSKMIAQNSGFNSSKSK